MAPKSSDLNGGDMSNDNRNVGRVAVCVSVRAERRRVAVMDILSLL